MDKLLSTSLGGQPETWDDVRWYLGQDISQGIYQALNNILGSYGNDFTVEGCVADLTIPTAATLTEGWVKLGGELLKVDAQTFDSTAIKFFTKVTTFDTSGDKILRSGSPAQTYEINRAVITANSGLLSYDSSRLSRIKKFTETQTNTVIALGVQTELMALTPTPTLTVGSMSIRGWIAVNIPSGTNLETITYNVSVGGAVKKTVVVNYQQIAVPINRKVIPFEWILPVIATQEVTINAMMGDAAGTFVEGILICESWDGQF